MCKMWKNHLKKYNNTSSVLKMNLGPFDHLSEKDKIFEVGAFWANLNNLSVSIGQFLLLQKSKGGPSSNFNFSLKWQASPDFF